MGQRLAIINPEAGAGRCGRMAESALEALRDNGLSVEARYTRHAGHAVELSRQAYAQGFRQFIAVGGDGTAHEIVNGLSPTFDRCDDGDDGKVSLGFLPLGTGNSFVRDFGPGDLRWCMERLTKNSRRPCDVIRVVHAGGTLDFINILSFGFVADVCMLATTRFRRLGSASYATAVFAKLGHLAPLAFRMQLDDAPCWEQETLVLSINNSQYTGGNMLIAPYADPTDGMLDILCVRPVPLPTFLWLFAKMFSGAHVHHPAVSTAQARRIDFSSERPLNVMVDGEVTRLQVREMFLLPSALDVVV